MELSQWRLFSTNAIVLKRQDRNVMRNIMWILLSCLRLRSLLTRFHSDSDSDRPLAHCIY